MISGAQVLVVGIGEMKFSTNPEEILVTYALGSCLGITVYDPVARVGGLLHAMMPLSTIDTEKARTHPARYVDTGVQRLFIESYKRGARKERMILTAAGGASAHREESGDCFQIGRRNILVLSELLRKNGVRMKTSHLGGCASRTVTLFMSDGGVTVVANAEKNALFEALRRQSLVAAY
jgi:chemotaxis protein CheD